MRKHRFSEEFGLAETIVAPNFQHDVRAARRTIFFDLPNAFVRTTGYRANFSQNLVRDSLGCGFSSALLHGIGNRLKFLKRQPGAFE